MISKKEKSEFWVKEETETNHVQKLEGAERLVAGEKTLGDDSLQRRHGAADEQENDALDRSFHLSGRRGSNQYITGTHEHRSNNDRD